jgi:predicted transcriptional regulator
VTKQPTTAISIRLPDSLLANIKTLAASRDVPYQSLIKMYLFERVEQERARKPLPWAEIKARARKLKSSKQ